MLKIKKGDEEFIINCNDKFCEGCCYLNPVKCTLFDTVIDHVVTSMNPGSKRCQQCIDAQIM